MFVSATTVFAVLIVMITFTASANELADGLFTYSVSGDYACITSCTDRYKYRLIIPEKIGIYTVKEIASGAFYGNEYLTEVEISEGVEIIGEYTFYMCSQLRSVKLPDTTVQIGENAFGECAKLQEMFLPDGVENIGENAFSRCVRITVSEGNGRFSSDENGVLFNKYGSVLLQYPASSDVKEYTVPSTVKRIEKRAFYQSENLRKVTFSKGLTYIGKEAFSESAIEEILLPDSVKKVGQYAFSRCPLKNAVLSESMSEISEGLFESCSMLENVGLSDNINKIGENAFFGCESLSDFQIPVNVETIGSGAFFGCKKLLKISVPEGIESIPDNTFYGAGLLSITLPQSMGSIGYEAFAYCDALKEIIYNGSEDEFKEIFIDRHNEEIEECEKIFGKPDTVFSIRKPSTKTLKYGDTLVLYTDAEEKVEWRVSGECAEIRAGDGGEGYVTPLKSGKAVISAHFTDENGTRTMSEISIRVKVNVFRKAVSYIKDLFGLTRYVF